MPKTTKIVCDLCDKEFKPDVSDLELFQHFLEEHKEKVEETAKNLQSNKKLLQKK